jgi:hypothetical protein
VAFQAVDLFISDTTPQHNPVSGVTVKVLSTDGTIVFGLTATDANGHAGFLLPDGATYQVRFFKFSVSFTNPQLITVPAGQAAAFNIPATLVTPPVPNDIRLCTAFGFFRDITGAPNNGLRIQFIAEFDPLWVDGAGVLKERNEVRTDKNGYAQINLFRHARYECTIAGEEDLVRKIAVPDLPNCNIVDLIFPIVASLVTTPPGPAFTITVGQEMPLGLKVYASDGECLGSGIGDIIYSTSDQSVLSYNVYRDGLTLIGVGPGTAQLCARRADRSIVHIPDLPIAGQPLIVTVLP